MIRRVAHILIIIAVSAALLPTVAADGPDYAVLGSLTLPWSCDEGHRISWDPQGHWEQGKAGGVAFDFAMPEGTPLAAPANGLLRYLRDDRALETTYGHYADLVVEGGDWMIRLAHLRDEQTGLRWVSQGDLVGYSGKSGVPVAHLHLELFVRQGNRWVAPDLDRITRFFGLPMRDFVEQAIISRGGCPQQLALAGQVRSNPLHLGDEARWLVPLRNQGLTPMPLSEVQITLRAPDGSATVLDVEGEWTLKPRALLSVGIAGTPTLAGTWRVERVAYSGEGHSGRFDATGETEVLPPALRAIAGPPIAATLRVGDTIAVPVSLANTGDKPLTFDGLHLEGSRPDGGPWRASAKVDAPLEPGETCQFTLLGESPALYAGRWSYGRVGFQRLGQVFFFGEIEGAVQVSGPMLRADAVHAYLGLSGVSVFLRLTNAGTDLVTPDALELWGWKPGGVDAFTVRHQRVAPLGPGRSALLRLTIPTEGLAGQWQLVEAGAWIGGEYYPIPLPSQPAVIVPKSASPKGPPVAPLHDQQEPGLRP